MDEQNKQSSSAPKAGNEERLQLLKSRLAIAKAWCKKPHEAFKKWMAEYNIEDFGDTDEIRDKVRIGYVFRKTESEVPAIFDDQPELFIKGRSAATKEIEPLIQGGYDYLWDIQRMEEVIEDAGVYFEVIGMGFVESPYVTKTKKIKQLVDAPLTDQLGQPILDPVTGQPQTQQIPQEFEVPIIDNPQATASNPFKLFFSPETEFGPIMDSEHCPYYFKEHTMISEKIEALFGKEVEANETLKTDDTDTDTEIERDSKVVKDDLKRSTVWEYYGSLPEDMAKDVKNDKGEAVEWTYDKEYHIWLTNNEELKIEECPYEYKPLFVVGNYGFANKFWKFGDAKHLMPLIQELQMYRSQILQHTRKMANPKPLIPTSANIEDQAFTDPRVGRPVKYEGAVAPSYLSPASLGGEVGVGIEQVRVDLEKTSPSFDLNGGGSQSQVKTPRGIQVFSEAADKNVRRKRKKIGRLIREIIIFQFKQLSQNWKPEDNKTLEVFSENGSEDVAVTQEVLDLFGLPQILNKLDIEVESLSVNRVQMKQDALNLWDSVKDRPDIFNINEVAKDLIQNGYGKKDADKYLISQNQQAQMIIQQFIAQVGQANPILGGQLAQFLSQPNMQQMNQTNKENAITQPQQQPAIPPSN